ncbi:hypothetical protein AJ80_00642 [Polytolypa hystricis UAMH7299]|uniref:Uncharacterized protein n=1 Tax=Polytolypa hystricis (strain UAMH7299) TaxID=1447883 RepID=A0A2B7Z309_POLH7|nr:hypothetical protein AJ80_00642 [Polytolypa hystricis UAMH7299]
MAREKLSDFDNFVRTIRLDELCEVASRCRGRDIMFSRAAHNRSLQSNPANMVNASYPLIERLSGHALPPLERKSFETDLKDLAPADKMHRSYSMIDIPSKAVLTSGLYHIAPLKFGKIGSPQEDSERNFFVGPYQGARHIQRTKQWCIVPLGRTNILKKMGNIELRQSHIMSFSQNSRAGKFKNGPFMINHNDLTVQNVLVGFFYPRKVDEEFDISGILHFPDNNCSLAVTLGISVAV